MLAILNFKFSEQYVQTLLCCWMFQWRLPIKAVKINKCSMHLSFQGDNPCSCSPPFR